MKKLILLFSILLLFGCNNQDISEQLKNINGYWEIKKVEVARDSIINYGMSQYIDYIEIKDSTGFRKKLQPQLKGGYIATNTFERVNAKIENNHLILYYATPYDSWKEEVLEAGEEELIIKNKDGKVYYYQRHEPLLSN